MYNARRFQPRLFGLIALSLFFAFASFAYASQAELDEINYTIRLKGARWLAMENHVSKLSPEVRKMRLGGHKPVLSSSEVISATSSTSTSSFTGPVPATLDWRNYNGYDYVTPIRDQGNCGDCWAFATTAALESNVLIAKGISVLDLDEQILVSCSGAGSCSGGYIDMASNFISSTGLPPESYYPYTATNGQCSSAALGWQSATSQITSWHWVTTTSPTVDAIKNDLNTYGPLVTTMDVYSDFYYYSGGVYQHTSGTYQGGHAILIVGYDDAGQYFIVKNSWGSGWGESGYFRIAYSQLSSVVNFGDYTIAYYTPTQPLVSITLTTSPSGEQINVDGTIYTAPQAFSWASGSSHTIGVVSPHSGGTGSRYVFSSWSDGGSQSHTITTPSADATYTASFITQYQLTISVNPSGGGSVNPNCSGGCWYKGGSSLTLIATPNGGYNFSQWSGAINSTSSTVGITTNGAEALTANFTVTSPPTGSIVINGGAAATTSTSVTLALTAVDASPGAIQMCISNTASCSAYSWTAFAATQSWALPWGDGIKTVNVWFRDVWGNTTPTPYAANIILDTAVPTDGTVAAVKGNTQVTLNWSGFTDAGSGIGGYKVVYAAGSAPYSCSYGATAVPGYNGVSPTYVHTGLTNGTPYYYRVCAIDKAGNISSGATASATPQ